jgi:hypothetical protein
LASLCHSGLTGIFPVISSEGFPTRFSCGNNTPSIGRITPVTGETLIDTDVIYKDYLGFYSFLFIKIAATKRAYTELLISAQI